MSLLDVIFKASIVRRAGIWAIVQSLPDESVLENYLRKAYMGIASVIVGSVLMGGAVTVGIISLYNLMIARGADDVSAIAVTAGLTLALILGCFSLTFRWFSDIAQIKNDIRVLPRPKASLSKLVGDGLNAVTDGFIEGLTKNKEETTYKSAKNIRLIRP